MLKRMHIEEALAFAAKPDCRRDLLLAALGEIGLKLQPSTGSEETIVVDHIERPTEN